jgi:hypothetical protein
VHNSDRNADRPANRCPAALRRLGGRCRSVVEWVRAGYPEDAPQTGYCPVIALTGPMSLTRRQTQQVLDRLRGHHIDTASINVAITEITRNRRSVDRASRG